MTSGREIELKLELEPEHADDFKRHPLLAGSEAKRADQVSTYYDTADAALAGAGFSLRVREAKGRFIQTVKRSSAGAAGMFDRPEWETVIEGPEPDLKAAAETPLASLLHKKIRKRLVPLVSSQVTRWAWDVDGDGTRIEVILDEGTITGGESTEALVEVEIELKTGEPFKLMDLARGLGQDVPLRLGVLTKAERGYRLADGSAGKVAKAEPIRLRPDMTAGEGFATIAYGCLRHFRLNEPLIVSRQDPGGLHQARVAMRRLRSAFTLFRSVISDLQYIELREEVRWFTNQLGDARNLDVMLKRFPEADTEPAEALRQRLQAERREAYGQVLEALASKRLRALAIELVAWIEAGEWRQANEMAALPIADYASAQLDKRWRKVKKGGSALAQLDPEPRHQLRIEVKKLRYAIEFLASLYRHEEMAQKQKAFVTALEEMQEQLGELNDIETAHLLLGNLFGHDPDSSPLLNYAKQRLEQPGSDDTQVAAAQRAHAELLEVGRFWR